MLNLLPPKQRRALQAMSPAQLRVAKAADHASRCGGTSYGAYEAALGMVMTDPRILDGGAVILNEVDANT
jgi:hypothetical protein